jgi:metal-sulfur cluster biosynthetic enzyme
MLDGESMIDRPEPEGSSADEASAERSGVTPGASGSADANAAPLSYADPVTEDQVRLALRKVKDPELNLNIIDLGLVYGIRVDGARVAIDMTLTSPACPAGPQIMTDAERVVKAMPGVGEVAVNLVWTPFWSPDLIEPRVRAYMGL